MAEKKKVTKPSTSEKLLQRMTKRASGPGTSDPRKSSQAKKKKSTHDLVDQYQIIRQDILKLRADLQKGYDMAKGKVEKKSLFGRLLRSR